jgi:hypothetical protein
MTLERIVLWAPRVLGLLFAVFLSLFALDVFGAGYGFWDAILAFLIHLLPVWVLLIGLALARRREWVGALVYDGFAIWYVASMWGPYPLVANLIGVRPIAGPLLLVALLFLASWRMHAHRTV